MRAFFIIFLLYPLFIYGKSIEDPVARHDANQCATYLCPSMPEYATTYLQEGCVGRFKDYMESKRNKEDISNLLLIEEEETSYKEGVGIDLEVVTILGVISGMISLGIGYYEKRRVHEERYRL